MASVTLEIPDELLERMRRATGTSSDADLQDHLLSWFETRLTKNQPLDSLTEKKLLAALETPLTEMTNAEWQALRDRVGAHQKE